MTDSPDRDRILAVIDQLEGLLPDANARVSVGVEAGIDESFLIGTSSGFLRLAIQLLRACSDDSPTADDVGGVAAKWTNYTHCVVDPLAEVCFGAEAKVGSDEDRAALREFFERISPPGD